jgi:hypothetical protein
VLVRVGLAFSDGLVTMQDCPVANKPAYLASNARRLESLLFAAITLQVLFRWLIFVLELLPR